ncbi:transcriptional regulator [Dorea formicigenerans]|uniref:Transcriptional regulator n=1 Tax=Dorea formicigenerans TaxID=39486 RepID=A0A413QET7_9FIRM|nr:transcriptional regulator [Dorea formicigenerans]
MWLAIFADALDMSEAAVLHHLRILWMNGLVRHRRNGKPRDQKIHRTRITQFSVSLQECVRN